MNIVAKIDKQEFSHVKDLDYYHKSIRGAWNKVLDDVLEVCSLCAEARQTLLRSEVIELRARLKFSDATFAKLAKIGIDSRISDKGTRVYLPTSYATLYELAHLSDAQFSAGIASGEIRPDMERDDAVRLRNPTGSSKAKKQSKDVLFEVRLIDKQKIDISQIISLVYSLSSASGIEVILSDIYKGVIRNENR